MNKLVLIVALALTSPALACQRTGLIELDCATRAPSKAAVNANDRMKGAVDGRQWDRWNEQSQELERAAAAKRAQERAERAQEVSARASRAIERAAQAEANRSNAAAGVLNRMYAPRPFQSGNAYGW
jgi:hypothetical protein